MNATEILKLITFYFLSFLIARNNPFQWRVRKGKKKSSRYLAKTKKHYKNKKMCSLPSSQYLHNIWPMRIMQHFSKKCSDSGSLVGNNLSLETVTTAQKMKFSIKDFFRKCDQIRRVLRIWSHLLKRTLMKNFIFCARTIGRTGVNLWKSILWQKIMLNGLRKFAQVCNQHVAKQLQCILLKSLTKKCFSSSDAT